MLIEHTMSWNELEALNGDRALVPILQGKGMVVTWSEALGKIIASSGVFYWEDNGTSRKFSWEPREFIFKFDNSTAVQGGWVPKSSQKEEKAKPNYEEEPIRNITLDD